MTVFTAAPRRGLPIFAAMQDFGLGFPCPGGGRDHACRESAKSGMVPWL